MNIYIPEIWEPYLKTWWQRFKKDSHWAWWEKRCICGAELGWRYYPALKKEHKRCLSDINGDRTKCPFYLEYDEMIRRRIIYFVPTIDEGIKEIRKGKL